MGDSSGDETESFVTRRPRCPSHSVQSNRDIVIKAVPQRVKFVELKAWDLDGVAIIVDDWLF
jgi:hypothetical protein